MKKICSVTLESDKMESKYIFYNNCKIQYMCRDISQSYNLLQWMTPGEISTMIRLQLLDNAPRRYKELIQLMLELHLRSN